MRILTHTLLMPLMAIWLMLPAIMTPAHAAPLSAAQEQAVDKLIADYFIRNPDKMDDALRAYQSHMQQQEELRFDQKLRDNADNLYNNKLDFSMGPADAPITIVEFFDYNCGYCKKVFAPLMEVMQENDDVRLIFKEFPILSEDSENAARIAMSIDDKLKFLTFHTKLMSHRGSINEAFIDKTLAEMKLDKSKLTNIAMSNEISAHIEGNRTLANELGMTGTPAFVINNQVFPGALEKQQITELIELARNSLKTKN